MTHTVMLVVSTVGVGLTALVSGTRSAASLHHRGILILVSQPSDLPGAGK